MFDNFLCLNTMEYINRDSKGGEMLVLLKAGLQIFLFFLLFQIQETFLQRLVLIGGGISTHDMHVVNTVPPLCQRFWIKRSFLCSSCPVRL